MSPPQKAGSFLSFLVAAVCRREPCKFSFFFNFTVQTLFLAHVYDFCENKNLTLRVRIFKNSCAKFTARLAYIPLNFI